MTSSSIRPRTRVAAIAGVVAFLLVVSSGAAWSYWTAQASATGTVTTPAVGVAQANFANPASTTYLPSALTSTRTFTVTNTGAIPGTTTIGLSAPESYASNLTLRVWPVASAGACSTTPPSSGVTTGTWASLTISATVGAGVSQIYCALTVIADWKTVTTNTGGAAINPVMSVTLDADGWIATTPTATHVQRTEGMFPLVTTFFDPALSSTWHTIRGASSTKICLDDADSGGAGTSVISWSCHTDANQRWQFLPVSGAEQSLVTIRPRTRPATRIATSAAGDLTIATASNAASQRWYVQRVSESIYQLVSAETGKCIPMANAGSNTRLVTVDCNAANARLSFVREGLTLSSAGRTATLTFGGANFGYNAGQTGTLERLTGSGWVAVTDSTIAATATTKSFTPQNGMHQYRIVFGAGPDVAYGPFTITRSGNGNNTVISGGSGLG